MNMRYLILSLFFSFFSVAASATIIGGNVTGGSSFNQGGVFVDLSVPFDDSNPANTVGNNTFQNPNLYGFNEDQNIRLTSDLAVDFLAGGGSGVINEGVTVASHYIFFDPRNSTTQQGSVTFDADILGVISSTENLLASDILFNNGVNYLNPNARGLEAGDAIDIVFGDTLTVDWRASTPGDYVRVLTGFSPIATPLPASIWMFLTGIVALTTFRKRKNFTKTTVL